MKLSVFISAFVLFTTLSARASDVAGDRSGQSPECSSYTLIYGTLYKFASINSSVICVISEQQTSDALSKKDCEILTEQYAQMMSDPEMLISYGKIGRTFGMIFDPKGNLLKFCPNAQVQ